MSNQRPTDTSELSDNGDGCEQQELAALRTLLFHDEQQQLDELKQQLADNQLNSERLSHMLPAAIQRATREDQELSKALGPTLAEAFQESVRRDPEALVDAISPIMGPAIRRAISQAISVMIQSLNQTLEHSLSWKSWRWRLEARRTGKPFAEIVLLHTLLYRAEQAFLIHRETGLLLVHAQSTAAVADADLVSGMLTAIEDFVRDSFGGSPQEELETMHVGEHTVWIESGPQAVLAVVIRGHAPESLRTKIREELEAVHVRHARELAEFDGDDSAFATTLPLLEQCLVTAYRGEFEPQTGGGAGRWKAWVAAAVLAAVLVAVGCFTWTWLRQRRLERWATALQLPATAHLQFRGGTLEIGGAARNEWIERLTREAARIPQIEHVDVSQLANLDAAWLGFLQRIGQEPGISISTAQAHDGKYAVTGLRDPLAADPYELLVAAGLKTDDVSCSWKPYQSLEIPLLQQRMTRNLAAPASVRLSWEGHHLRLRGEASTAWLADARATVESMAAWISVDFSQVSNIELAQFRRLETALESVTVCHQKAGEELLPGQREKLQQAADAIEELTQLARELQQPLRVTILGHAARDEAMAGSVIRLSEQRARAVWRLLVRAGASPTVLVVTAMGDAEEVTAAGESLAARHCCSFRVQLGQQ